MPEPLIYLDHAATTPLHPAAAAAMQALEAQPWGFANPASQHPWGQQARQTLEATRGQLAQHLGLGTNDTLHFTSGATEANNWVLRGVLQGALKHPNPPKPHLVTARNEHAAVLQVAQRLESEGLADVTYVAPNTEGVVPVEAVLNALQPHTVLVSLMLANNETGALNPLAELAPLLKARGVLLHSDCVQALGKLPFHFATLGVDYATVSAHKAYGPKGVGALLCQAKAPVPTPLLWGGGQEDGYRAGTTPLALIVGFEAALAATLPTVPAQAARLEGLITHTIAQLAVQAPPDASYRINTPQQRVAGVLNLSLPKQRGDAMVLKLGMKGFALSSGSACHGDSVAPSHVLLAQGRNTAEALGALRISLGPGTTAEHLEALLPHLLRWL